jgi:hypothetical protein
MLLLLMMMMMIVLPTIEDNSLWYNNIICDIKSFIVYNNNIYTERWWILISIQRDSLSKNSYRAVLNWKQMHFTNCYIHGILKARVQTLVLYDCPILRRSIELEALRTTCRTMTWVWYFYKENDNKEYLRLLRVRQTEISLKFCHATQYILALWPLILRAKKHLYRVDANARSVNIRIRLVVTHNVWAYSSFYKIMASMKYSHTHTHTHTEREREREREQHSS